MADDVLLNLGSGGDLIAADDIGPGVKYQRVKLTLGADGVNDGDVSNAVPIPADIREIGGTAVAVAQTDDDIIAGALVHQAVVGLNYGWDGTNWERLQTDAAGALDVNITAQTGGLALAANQLADGHAVTVDNAGVGAAVNIQDGGNSITVDAPVATPVNVQLGNGTSQLIFETDDDLIVAAQIHAVQIGLMYGFDGTQWERLKTDAAGSLNVAIISGAGGPEDTDDNIVAGGQSANLGIGLNYGWDGANWERIITGPAGHLRVSARGPVDHDEPISGNPLHIGARASTAVPAAVSLDGDLTQLWADRRGALKGVMVDDAGVSCMDGTNNALQVNVVAGSAGGPTDTDDGIIAGGQTVGLNAALIHGWDGTQWGRAQVEADDDSIAGAEAHLAAIGLNYGWNGTVWERLQTDGAGSLDVNITAGATSGPTDTDDDIVAGGQLAGLGIGLNYGWDGAQWERITTDGLGALDIRRTSDIAEDGSIIAGSSRPLDVSLLYGYDGAAWERINSGGEGALFTQGAVAFDAPVAGNPVLVGGRASLNVPAIVDADGDSVWAWFDRSGRQIVRERNIIISDTLTAVDTFEAIDTEGAAVVAIDISGTFSATYIFEATIDGVTWFGVAARIESSRAWSGSSTSPTRWFIPCQGYDQIRVYVSAYTSGTIQVDMQASSGASHILAATGLDSSGNPVFITFEDDDDAIAGGDTRAASMGLLYGWDSTNWVRIGTDNNQAGTLLVGGAVDFDSPVSNRPMVGGGRASSVEPTAMSTDGDAVHNWATREGSMVVAGFDGTNPQHIAVDSGGKQMVVGGAADGASPVGNPVAIAGFDGTLVQSIRTDAGGFLRIILTDGTDSVAIDGGGRMFVGGQVGHDSPMSGFPLLGGARASNVEPTPVSLDGDATWGWMTREGSQVMAGFDGTNPQHLNVDSSGALRILDLGALTDTDDDSIAGAQSAYRNLGLMHGWDGAQWERLATSGEGQLHVTLVDDNGDSVLDAANNSVRVVGAANHDATAVGNPVRIAGKSNDNEPTAVTADGDVVDAWMDRLGRIVTVAGHPSPELPITVNATGAGDTTVIAAPGASLSLYIKRAVLSNQAAAVNPVFLQESASAVNRGGAALAADGGGVVLDYGDRGWKLSANTALQANLENAGDVWVSVLDYYIAA